MNGAETESACFEDEKIGANKIVRSIFEEGRNALIAVLAATMIQ